MDNLNLPKILDYIVTNPTIPACPVQYLDVIISNQKCEKTSTHSQIGCGNFPFAKTSVFTSTLSEAQTLIDNNDSKTIHEIVLDMKNSENDISYFPGDTIGILPQNTNEDVEHILKSLGYKLDADYVCEVKLKSTTTKKAAKVPFYIPTKSTPRKIIRDCLNLRSIPKKLFCRSLANYTSNVEEKGFLESISAKEGAQAYTELTSNGSITFTNLLKLCPSCKPPLSLLLEHLPRLLPRPYSIANSPLTRKDKVKIIFSVLRSKPGVTTKMLEDHIKDYLQQRKPNEIYMYLREPTSFRYTNEDLYKNSILISIGCGIAPFIGFLEHKAKLMENRKNGENIGKTWSFVGNRYCKSAIYRNELLYFKKINVLDELYESFSKDPESNFKYVQDEIKENKKSLVEFLTKLNAILYVCADGAEISKSIEKCIKESLMNVLEQSDKSVDDLILKLKKSGQYREDIW